MSGTRPPWRTRQGWGVSRGSPRARMLLVPPSRATVRAEPWTRLERPRREAGEGVRPAPARERVPRPSAEVSTACWAEHGWQRGTSGGAGRPWRSDSGPRSEDQGCTEHDRPPAPRQGAFRNATRKPHGPAALGRSAPSGCHSLHLRRCQRRSRKSATRRADDSTGSASFPGGPPRK